MLTDKTPEQAQQSDLLTELMDHAFNDGRQGLASPSPATQEAEQRFRDSCQPEQTQQSEREAFESWYVSVEGERVITRGLLWRVQEGPYANEYRDGRVQGAWNTWQAARAAMLAAAGKDTK